MKVFIAKKDVNLFGRIDIKKNDRLIVNPDFNLTHNGVLHESPINEIGLELVEILFSTQETRNYKLKILGV